MSTIRTQLATAKAAFPGVLVASLIGLASAFLTEHWGGPLMVWALALGMALHPLAKEKACKEGIRITSSHILRLGVMLLGARITLSDIQSLGVMPVLLAVVAVSTTIGFGLWMSKRLGLSPEFGVLTGGSVAICGASAAMAVSSVLPRRPEAERETLLTVVMVTALSSVAMVLYPMLASALGLNAHEAGVFMGGSIHDVAQVMGAGETFARMENAPAALPAATIMKLLRVATLVPVVFFVTLGFAKRQSEASGPRPPALPWFLVGFVILAAISSLGFMPAELGSLASTISKACLVIAVAAVGMKTALADLLNVGWRPALLIVLETLVIGTVVLGSLLLA